VDFLWGYFIFLLCAVGLPTIDGAGCACGWGAAKPQAVKLLRELLGFVFWGGFQGD